MSNKVKLILIIVEVLVLLVLFLLGAACQQRWIVITGTGPRIDWYTDDAGTDEPEPDTDPIVNHSPAPEQAETTEPVVTPPPATTEPEETTEEPTEDPTETTITETEPGFVPPPDDWETDEF